MKENIDVKWNTIGARLTDLHSAWGWIRNVVGSYTYEEYARRCAEGYVGEDGKQVKNTVICGKCLTPEEVPLNTC